MLLSDFVSEAGDVILCRYSVVKDNVVASSVGALIGENVLPLELKSLNRGLEQETVDRILQVPVMAPSLSPGEIKLLAPVERQEIWGAGMTFRRELSADKPDLSIYEKAYLHNRPFLFYKGNADEAVPHRGVVRVRMDSSNTIAEPELAVFVNQSGQPIGFSIGSEVTARDIEAENPLFLSQAKAYEGGCAIGPGVRLCDFDELRHSEVRTRVARADRTVFTGTACLSDLMREPIELAHWLKQTSRLRYGAVILTGNNVPFPDQFSLQHGDVVTHEIDGLGVLQTAVETR